MRSLAALVPRSEGERVRRQLKELGLLRMDLVVAQDGEFLLFPLRAPPPEGLYGGRIEEREFEEAPRPAPASYTELADVPEEVRPFLPRAFDVIGDIVLVRLDRDQSRWSAAIGEALLRFVPGARLVAWDRGIHGEARLRTLQPIAGTGGFRTVHPENGLRFRVDLERAYFSPRLGREHARVAALGRPSERVADLCCGIGPFGLTLLRSAGSASAVFVDSNPGATALVEENATQLGVRARTEIRTEGLAEFLSGGTVSDRVIFNLPHGGIKYASQVGEAVGRGGTLHYYEIMERSSVRDRVEAFVRQLPGPTPWSLRDQHVVHPYSPDSDLIAVTAQRTGA
jgi:tRNA (guanine37-N1)-methyltransferase